MRQDLLSRPLGEIISENPDPVIVKGVVASKILDMRRRPAMLKKIEADAGYFARHFVKTYNEANSKTQSYPNWPFLYDIVFPKFHTPGNRMWEKAQRMLITVAATTYFFWAWLTQKGFTGWMTSRKENKVDDGGGHSTWDSLFGKIRFYYEQLSRENPWVIEHFMGSVQRSDIVFRYMIATNEKQNSGLYGEAPVPTAPTGSGFTKALVDEAAVVPQHHSIHGNLMFACPNGTHYVSYPDGMGNHFAKIRHEKGHFGFEIVEIDFRMRPDYNDAWLRKQEIKLTKDELGRRVLRSYSTSAKGRVWENFSREKNTMAKLKVDVSSIELWFDFGFVDATSVGIMQIGRIESKGEIKPMILGKAWLEVNHTKYAEIARALKVMLKGIGHKGETLRIVCIGDPQVKQRSVSTGTSLHDLYKLEGFNIEAAPAHDIKATMDEIDRWFGESRIIFDSECTAIIKAAENWTWPKDRNGNVIPGSTNPAHSEFSHAGKAFEYGFAYHFMRKVSQNESCTDYDERDESDVLNSIGLRSWHL